MRAVGAAAAALALACATPAGADGFLPEPDNCHSHPHTTRIHVVYVAARYTTCEIARHVTFDWLHNHGACHATGYCKVLQGTWSCHTTYSHGYYATHCTSLDHHSREAFMGWKRI